MRPYQTQDSSLHNDYQAEQIANLQSTYRSRQLVPHNQSKFQNLTRKIKNCLQKQVIIGISALFICFLLFTISPFSQSSPYRSTEDFFSTESTEAILSLLKNTLSYGINEQATETPLLKVAKDHNITQSQIENAITFTQIIPAYRSETPQKISIFQQLSRQDFMYLDKAYSIKKHNQNQVMFCIVLPQLIQKPNQQNLFFLKSILRQNYNQYKFVWPSSNSTDQDKAFEAFIKKYDIDKERQAQRSFKIKNSTLNSLQNTYFGIKEHCHSGEVVFLVDQIDYLIGTNILSLFNAIIQQKKPLVLYSEYLKINYTDLIASLSDFPTMKEVYSRDNSFKNVSFVDFFPLISFSVDTFLSIPLEYLIDQNQKFYSNVWQNALMKPLFQLSGHRSHYLNEITFATNATILKKIDKSQIHYLKELDQIKRKKQLEPLDKINIIFQTKQSTQSTSEKKSENNPQEKGNTGSLKSKQIQFEKNLLKDQENDLEISQDQQPKFNQQKQVQKAKNRDQQKIFIGQKTKHNQNKNDLNRKTSKDLQIQNSKQKLLPQQIQQPEKQVDEESGLKQPVLSIAYQNDRDPLQQPNIVKAQAQIDRQKPGNQEIDETKEDKNQKQQPIQKIETKKEQTVIIDGKKSIKSTEVLPFDEMGGFLQIDDQEQSEQLNLPNLDKKVQSKKVSNFVTNKMDIKGPNYNFNVSIQEMINTADLEKIFGKKKSKQGIWKNQFLEAIQKLEITNNVKYGGQLEVQLSKYDNDKFEKVKRIQELIKTDTDYLDSNYKINEYKKKELPFCIVVSSYQNVKTGLYLRNLNSIFMQNYTNYHIVYIDDASTDNLGQYVKSYVVSRSIPLQKIQVIKNKDNRKPPYNIYNAITNHCKLGQLALIVEGDDALLGTNILSLYNAIYQRDKCAMIYSSYLQIFQNSRVQLGIAHQIMDDYFQKNAIRTISEIPGKYLLSFYVDVFKSIQVHDFKDPKGYFFWFAYDRALITPLLQVSYPRISIVKEILYEHRRDTDKQESPIDWNRESAEILAKKPYKPLKFFPFIERNKYKYFIDAPIEQVIQNSDFDAFTFLNNFQIEGITKDMHIRSIKLLELIHNVKFGGQIQIQLAEYESSKEQKHNRLLKVLEQDKKYYNDKYNIDFYRKQELPFCIVTPSYNNVKSGLYLRNLDSVFMQDYNNYHVVYIDDCSPDKTGQFVNKYLEEKKIPQKHIEVIINKENKKAMYNLHMGIHKYCKSGQIVTIIDGDDSFLGRNVLSLFNAVYQKQKAAMAYSNFLTIHNNDRTEIGFCHDIDKQTFEQNTFRNSWDLPGTHLMTFYSDLFKKIKISDLTYPNGTFYDYAYDRAILTPLLQMAYPRIGVIKQITYEYRNDTGINDAPDDWSRVSHIILDKKPYGHLEQFPFIKGLIVSTDKFNIKAEIETVIKNTNLTIYEKQPNKKITGIAKEQHIHAIRLTQLVHNINFQGQVDVSLKNTKNAEKKKQRLEKLLKNDREYLQAKYDISQYKQKELPFCIVVSSHNSVQNGLYMRNLNSIFMQDYKNYRIVFIDDDSPKQSEDYINKYLQEQRIPSHVIKIIRNDDKKKELSNIYFAAHNQCELNEIILIIGENDALIGRNVLSVLNARYQKEDAKVGFSCFLKVFNSSTQLGTCADINSFYFKTNTFRNHLQYEKYRLMSFYAHIFRRIKIKDLTFENGTFFSNAIDKAIMVPLIEMSYPNVLVVKDIIYEDRFDKESRDAEHEGIEANVILSKDAYERLQNVEQYQTK